MVNEEIVKLKKDFSPFLKNLNEVVSDELKNDQTFSSLDTNVIYDNEKFKMMAEEGKENLWLEEVNSALAITKKKTISGGLWSLKSKKEVELLIAKIEIFVDINSFKIRLSPIVFTKTCDNWLDIKIVLETILHTLIHKWKNLNFEVREIVFKK